MYMLAIEGADENVIQDLGMSEIIANEYKDVYLFVGLLYLKSVKAIQTGYNKIVIKEMLTSMIPSFLVWALREVLEYSDKGIK